MAKKSNKIEKTLEYPLGKEPKFKSYQSRDEKNFQTKNMISQIDFDNLSKNDCFYCGKPGPNGIDRVDNNKGYELSNCVPCCKHCNYVKGALSVKNLKIWSQRFIDHQNLTGSIQTL